MKVSTYLDLCILNTMALKFRQKSQAKQKSTFKNPNSIYGGFSKYREFTVQSVEAFLG